MSSNANEILAQFQHTFSDVFSPTSSNRPSGGDLDTYSPGVSNVTFPKSYPYRMTNRTSYLILLVCVLKHIFNFFI